MSLVAWRNVSPTRFKKTTLLSCANFDRRSVMSQRLGQSLSAISAPLVYASVERAGEFPLEWGCIPEMLGTVFYRPGGAVARLAGRGGKQLLRSCRGYCKEQGRKYDQHHNDERDQHEPHRRYIDTVRRNSRPHHCDFHSVPFRAATRCFRVRLVLRTRSPFLMSGRIWHSSNTQRTEPPFSIKRRDSHVYARTK